MFNHLGVAGCPSGEEFRPEELRKKRHLDPGCYIIERVVSKTLSRQRMRDLLISMTEGRQKLINYYQKSSLPHPTLSERPYNCVGIFQIRLANNTSRQWFKAIDQRYALGIWFGDIGYEDIPEEAPAQAISHGEIPEVGFSP